MTKGFTINQLVQKTKLAENIIRYYVTQELIKPKPHPLRKKRQLLFNSNTDDRVIVIRALWELGFTMEEIKSILKKTPNFDLLRKKVATLPFAKLMEFLRVQGVDLLERTYLRRLLGKTDLMLCIF